MGVCLGDLLLFLLADSMSKWTQEDVDAIRFRRERAAMPPKSSAPKRQKYGAQPVEVDGIRFDSKKESHRYNELKAMQHGKLISRLILQPHYHLFIKPFPSESVPKPEMVNCGEYRGDFQYVDGEGTLVVEDVKSRATKTETYRLKKRIVEALYSITIREV